MSTHIALLGRTEEPILKGYQHYGEMKCLYLLHSPDSSEFQFKELALGIKKKLKAVGFDRVILKQIDAFDMNDVVNAIVSVVDSEKPPYYVNITGGTNLMAGAATAASFFIGAKAYYVYGKKGDDLSATRVIELPIPNIPYYRNVEKSQLRILKALESLGGKASNQQLREALDVSPQILSYHVKELTRKGLLVPRRGASPGGINETDNRVLTVEITSAGRLVSSWTS